MAATPRERDALDHGVLGSETPSVPRIGAGTHSCWAPSPEDA